MNRREKFEEIRANIIIGTMLVITIILFIFAINRELKSDYTYAIASESEGKHYEYVTDKVCTVREISGNLITVECNGNLYQFYGNGYKLNQQIICTFNSENEIIEAR